MSVTVNVLKQRNAPLRPVLWLNRVLEIRSQRLALAQLDKSQLQDIGVSEEKRQRETSRRIWDI